MPLRPYQNEFIEAVEAEHAAGNNKQLGQLPTGCHAKGQKLLMYDGNIKEVQDIQVGDLLMGPDSAPRTVINLCGGRGRMVRITPRKGDPFVVNDHHVLTLVRTRQNALSRYKSQRGSDTLDVCLHEVMRWSKYNLHIHKLFRVPVEFSRSEGLPIPPKDVLRTGFSLTQLGVDDYYGFTLDGDGRYLMADFTVTHNTGKTEVIAGIAQRMQAKEKMVFFVATDELAFQGMDKLQKRNPDKRVGMEKAQFTADARQDDIVVASIQTIGKVKKVRPIDSLFGDAEDTAYSDRLRKFDPSEFTHIICDESHHITAPTYHGPLRYFNVFKPDPQFDDPAKLLLGVTATVNRSDNLGLEAYFDKIVFSRDLRDMIKQGWLVDLKAFRVATETSLVGVSVRNGDYARGELGKAVNTKERNELVVDKYLSLGEGMPFIAFTVDIAHSDNLAAAFQERGIKAYAISSNTPKDERRALVEAFRNREIPGLCSCQALLEGFDAPCATVGLWCRPTKSPVVLQQGVGRVLRPYPSPEEDIDWTGWRKPGAILIDFVDIAGRHPLCTIPSLMGLKADFDVKGKSLLETVEEVEKLQEKAKGAIQEKLYADLDTLRGMVEKLDLFAKPVIPDEAKRFSKFAWVTGMAAGYSLILPEKQTFQIRENALGQWDVYRSMNGARTFLKTAVALDSAFRFADAMVPQEAQILVRQAAKWRLAEPTDAQLRYLGRLYPEMRKEFRDEVSFCAAMAARYSKGDVSVLLSARDKRLVK
jgi:ATP-dependent helicase IRC3